MTLRLRMALAACCGCGAALLAPDALAGALGSRHGKVSIERVRLDARVEEGLVTAELEQLLRNDADALDEAVYDLPLPDRATFAGLSVWVDGREVQGEVVSRARAEAVYGDVTGVEVSQARERRSQPGSLRAPARSLDRPRVEVLAPLRTRDPGLLELLDGRTLRLRLAPLPAHGTYRVKVRWVQPAVVRGGRGRVLVPLAPAEAEAVTTERLDASVLVSGAPGRPIQGVTAASHPDAAVVDLGGAEAWSVGASREGARLDQDLEVTWDVPRPAQPGPTIAVAAARGDEGEGTALLSITPWLPEDAARRPRDVVIAVDVSSSMAPRARDAYAAAERVIGSLDPADRFELLLLGLAARGCHGALVPADPAARARALAALRAARPGPGGTDPRAALRALRGLRQRGERGPRPLELILVTDAGLSRDDALLRALEAPARGSGVRVSAVELGTDRAVSAPLARLARATGGVALPGAPGRAAAAATELVDALAAPALFGPRLTLEGLPFTQVQPATAPAVLSEGTQVHVLGRYARPGVARAVLEGTLADGSHARWTVPVELPARGRHPEVARLWAQAAADEVEAALHRPGLAAGARAALAQELERVSLAGPVLTRATALLVLDGEQAFRSYGIDRRNRDLVSEELAAEQERLDELHRRLEQRRREAPPQDDVVAQAPRVELWRAGGLGGGMGGGGGGGGAGEPLLLLLAASAAAAAVRARGRGPAGSSPRGRGPAGGSSRRGRSRAAA